MRFLCQTDSQVIITILIKKVSVESVSIDYGDDSLRFSVPIPGEEGGLKYELDLKLARRIEKELCVFKVTPSKVEIKLKKGTRPTRPNTRRSYDSSRISDLKSCVDRPTDGRTEIVTYRRVYHVRDRE